MKVGVAEKAAMSKIKGQGHDQIVWRRGSLV